MKLLFTQDALVNAGAERSHLEILSRFSSEVDVGFVYFYPKHELKEAYEGAGIRLFFLDIPESYHFPLAIFRLIKLIRTEKPDLLISSLWRADMITRIASLITGVPLMGTLVNDSYSPIAWTDKKGLKYKLVFWLDRLTAWIPVYWIANAQALADSHVKTLRIKPERISVVYRGRSIASHPPRSLSSPIEIPSIPSGDWLQTEQDTQSPPRSLSPPTETRVKNFISYGRLLERKGFQDAIRAFSQVVKDYPHSTLTIFGEGPYRTNLEKVIFDLGLQKSVFLPGKIPNPMDALINGYCLPRKSSARVLITAHCFLFPSWYEGFSGALVEAMMAGIPIIASDIPMNLEAIEADKSALVFPVGNVAALADQLLFAIQNPDRMEELGMEAREVAIRNFDIEVIAKEYEEVLKGILP